MTEPPKGHSNAHPNYSSEANEMTNDVQRDQSASPPQQEEAAHSLSTTMSNAPTDPPFISFPVTKTPGTSVWGTSYSRGGWVRLGPGCTSLSIFCQSYLAAQISRSQESQ